METKFAYDELRRRYTFPKTEQERTYERIRFGQCVVDVPEKSIWKLLTSEVLNPFYIF